MPTSTSLTGYLDLSVMNQIAMPALRFAVSDCTASHSWQSLNSTDTTNNFMAIMGRQFGGTRTEGTCSVSSFNKNDGIETTVLVVTIVVGSLVLVGGLLLAIGMRHRRHRHTGGTTLPTTNTPRAKEAGSNRTNEMDESDPSESNPFQTEHQETVPMEERSERNL